MTQKTLEDMFIGTKNLQRDMCSTNKDSCAAKQTAEQKANKDTCETHNSTQQMSTVMITMTRKIFPMIIMNDQMIIISGRSSSSSSSSSSSLYFLSLYFGLCFLLSLYFCHCLLSLSVMVWRLMILQPFILYSAMTLTFICSLF